jgi:hypothetical protein
MSSERDRLAAALFQWEEGRRRVDELRADPAIVPVVDRVLGAIADELRRRIGPTFNAAELAELYGRGTEWCLEVALQVAPGEAAALDAQAMADAAFFEHLRGATDYAGGRRIETEEEEREEGGREQAAGGG